MNKTFWHQKIQFGNLTVPRIMSAPMDGITDSPFRQIVRCFSTDELIFTEMRHVAQVVNEKDKKSLHYAPCEKPVAFQFSANKIDFVEQAAELVIARGFDMINLNACCPARVVIGSGSGSALMANMPLLETLIKLFIKTINGRVPFTIKLRAGFKEKNALDVAKMAQNCGVVGVIIHPRTQPGGFTSELDFDIVQQIKQALTIPVIFSGNITSFEKAHQARELTGVDGVMIGRALWGSPWKMLEMKNAIAGTVWTPTPAIAIACLLRHIDLCEEQFGPGGFVRVKKHVPEYINSLPGASLWRHTLLRSTTVTQLRTLIKQLITENNLEQTTTQALETLCKPS